MMMMMMMLAGSVQVNVKLTDMPFGNRPFRREAFLVSPNSANFEDVMFTDHGGQKRSTTLCNLSEIGTFYVYQHVK